MAVSNVPHLQGSSVSKSVNMFSLLWRISTSPVFFKVQVYLKLNVRLYDSTIEPLYDESTETMTYYYPIKDVFEPFVIKMPAGKVVRRVISYTGPVIWVNLQS
jgi:hypothetical protein